ncbi:MAG: hypothetical protein IPN76_28275 [Saprospiraceae bacterium]|nr:hypothetical protein [Saprospiraceae bacterium]
MRRLFVVAAWMLATLNLIAQSLSGSVYDANSNLPLPGATILLKGPQPVGTPFHPALMAAEERRSKFFFTLRPSGRPPLATLAVLTIP